MSARTLTRATVVFDVTFGIWSAWIDGARIDALAVQTGHI